MHIETFSVFCPLREIIFQAPHRPYPISNWLASETTDPQHSAKGLTNSCREQNRTGSVAE
ncbi:hypothetical protein K0M31_005403 [Melipona bicolor]|uniref:Uncharacterized protein n=1 Tax=Melipona bicolor TaxID=60889 RepID=A0AA40KMD9_9HYME|nr:hypothetical protein K0M31_005403 [Melipona bicolor]